MLSPLLACPRCAARLSVTTRLVPGQLFIGCCTSQRLPYDPHWWAVTISDLVQTTDTLTYAIKWVALTGCACGHHPTTAPCHVEGCPCTPATP